MSRCILLSAVLRVTLETRSSGTMNKPTASRYKKAPPLTADDLIHIICPNLLNQSLNVPSQVEFQDQSQQMLKPSEIHQMDQELPKRVRARLVSTLLKWISLMLTHYVIE